MRTYSRPIILCLIFFANFAGFPKAALAAGCLSSVNAPGCSYGLPADQYQALLAVMQTNPVPSLPHTEVDPAELLRYSDTHQTPARMASPFTGAFFNGAPPLPVAWILVTTRPHVLPLYDADHVEAYVSRYTMVYIFASQKVDGVTWDLIGPAEWIRSTALARLILPTNPGVGGRWVAIDVAQQTLTAWEGTQLVLATLISSGAGQRVTRLGLSHVYLRQESGEMTAMMGTPNGYDFKEVPWVMYFNNGEALHGTSWHNNFGAPMSHGCVNMSMTDAHWLFGWSATTLEMPVYVWRSK